MRNVEICLSALFALSLCQCKKPENVTPETPPSVTKPAVDKPVEKPAPPPPAPVGMVQPFTHLSNEAAKPFNAGWVAMKAKKYDDAATAFGEVTTALPDYLPARFQVVRADLLAGKMAEARQQLEELLSRSYLAYAGRATSAKEFAAFRASTEWATYQQAETRLRAAYAQGLEHGLILVARSSGVDPASFVPSKMPGISEIKLDLKQEVLQLDPDANRYRPLTATDGRVLAALRSPDGKRLVFVTAERVQKDDKLSWFADAAFAFVDLATLDTAGPVKLNGGYEWLTIGFGATGTPIITTSAAVAAAGDGLAAGSYELDTARTGLAKAATDPEIKGERVTVRPDRLLHLDRPGPTEVSLSEDRHSVKLPAGGMITSARALSESSLAWSPGQRFFLYAGQLDGCAALRDEKSKAAQNELYVYEIEKKAATRVDSGPSTFETAWLGDYLFAYESGSGAKATLNLYDLATKKKTALPLHHGAGLYGIPTLICPETAGVPTAPAPAAPVPGAPAAPIATPVAAPAAAPAGGPATP